MTKNNSKRSHAESDVNHQISNEAMKRRKEHHQQIVVNKKEYPAITADRSFAQFCIGNAVTHIEEKNLQTN